MDVQEVAQWMDGIEVENSDSIDDLIESYGESVEDYDPSGLATSQEGRSANLAEVLNPIIEQEGDAETASVMFNEAVDQSPGIQSKRELSADDLVELREHRGEAPIPAGQTIGTPGTPFWDGQIQIEPSYSYRPFQLRGRLGDPGILEEFYRTEPIVRDSVDSITEIQVGADWRVRPPSEDRVKGKTKDELRKWARRIEKAFKNIRGGWDRYIFNAANSTSLFGFAPFQITWRRAEDGLVVPKQIMYHEAATVEEWVMDGRQSDLLGVKFNAGLSSGGGNRQWTLPAMGPRLEDQRFLLCRIAGRGNNWEGTAPARTSAHWVKFKKLLGQIAAATAQKYGVPTTFIRLHEQFFTVLDDIISSGASDEDAKKAVVQQLDAAEATDAAIVGLPDGLIADLQSPSGTMPDFESLIRYCDEQIAKPWSNEGSLLGHQDTGSYALAEQKENAFMRSAPMYARAITEPIDKIIKRMTRRQFGERWGEYPSMEFKLDAMHDTSEFVENMAALFPPNVGIQNWPEKTRHEIAKQAGLEEGAFDPDGSMPLSQREQGRQQMRETTAEWAEGLSFQEDDDGGGDDDDDEEGEAQFTDFSAKDANERMDRIEEDLAERFLGIAETQRDRFVERTEGARRGETVREAKEELEEAFRPRYLEVIRRASRRLVRAGAASLLVNLDIDVEGVDTGYREIELQEDPILQDELFSRLPPLPSSIREPLHLQEQALAEELSARNAGHMRDQKIEQVPPDDDDEGISTLALASLGGVAGRLGGRGFNAGREGLMVESTRRTREAPEVEAVRSSMLDGDVCTNCFNLDFNNGGPTFVVGTSRYSSNHPPKKCLAGNRCRCVMIHRVPRQVADTMRAVIGPTMTFQDSPLTSGFE